MRTPLPLVRVLPLLLIGLAVLIAGCNLTSSVPVQEPLPVTPGITTTPSITAVSGLPTRTPQSTLLLPTLIGGTLRPPSVPNAVVQPPLPGIVVVPTNPIVIPPPPLLTPVPVNIAILSPVPGSVIAGTNVQVLGSASHPNFLQYQVEFGPDPNPNNLWYLVTSPVTQPVNNALLGIWNTLGLSDSTYQLRLRVFLRDGTTQQTVVSGIRVQNSAATPIPTATPSVARPIAAFSPSVTSGQAPLTVQFTNQSFGQITGYNWNFGSGSSSTDVNPSHTYTLPGLYNVTLTVIGPGGTSNVSSQINVQSPTAPVAAFTQSIASGQAPLTVQFTDTSRGAVTSYFWNFSDGSTSSQRNPAHTFTTPGLYNVFLTITGAGGSSFASGQVNVLPPPTVTGLPATAVPPTTIPPTAEPPTQIAVLPTNTTEPPTAVPPTTEPATAIPPTAEPPTLTPEPPTTEPPTITPLPSETPTIAPTETPLPTAVPITISDTQPVQPNFSDPNVTAGLRGTYDAAVNAGTPPTPSSVLVGGDALFSGTGVLTSFGAPGYNTNNDPTVQAAVDFYGGDPDGDGQNSFNRGSGGLNPAWTAAQIVDPASADPGICPPGETPIACAVRVTGSAVIVLSVGANDVQQGTDPAAFSQSLTSAIGAARAAGAIPLLVTVPPRPDQADRVRAINDAILNTANANGVPVVNLTPVLATLPNGGLNPDNVTLSVAPSGPGDLGAAGQYGVNAANLELLRALAALRGAVFPETLAP